MMKQQNKNPASYIELKIVSNNSAEFITLIEAYERLGFTHDGSSQFDGDVYWTHLKFNNGLIEV